MTIRTASKLVDSSGNITTVDLDTELFMMFRQCRPFVSIHLQHYDTSSGDHSRSQRIGHFSVSSSNGVLRESRYLIDMMLGGIFRQVDKPVDQLRRY